MTERSTKQTITKDYTHALNQYCLRSQEQLNPTSKDLVDIRQSRINLLDDHGQEQFLSSRLFSKEKTDLFSRVDDISNEIRQDVDKLKQDIQVPEACLSQQLIAQHFQRLASEELISIQQVERAYVPCFEQASLLLSKYYQSIKIQKQKSPEQQYQIKTNIEDLHNLKRGKPVPESFVTNFILLLENQKELLPNSQILPLSFIPTLVNLPKDEHYKDEDAAKKICQTYQAAKRRLKNYILSSKISFLPFIQEDNHYSLIIVLKQTAHSIKIIFCDSRYTKERFSLVLQMLKQYLKREHREIEPTARALSDASFQTLQLLLPKIMRKEDSGIHMMLNMESLLLKKGSLSHLEIVANRNKLHLYSRTMALSMRSRIWNLYASLCQPESDKNLLIDNFFKRKEEASDIEGHNLFDIDSFYFKKGENKEIEIFEMLVQRKLSKNDEDRFSNTVKLYYCKTISRYLE